MRILCGFTLQSFTRKYVPYMKKSDIECQKFVLFFHICARPSPCKQLDRKQVLFPCFVGNFAKNHNFRAEMASADDSHLIKEGDKVVLRRGDVIHVVEVKKKR